MKLDLPVAVRTLIQKLNEEGYEAYAVGGCVRDSLMGKAPQDWDITTSAPPATVAALFQNERVAETGLKHGTVTVGIGGMFMEVTTFRQDSAYADHRHPDSVSFTLSLREDLARRDFTVNAMAYHPDRGLIDFFEGQQDLSRRRIRCVGDPDKRFSEDALRLLRALRFSATLGFPLDPATARSLHRRREDLQYVAQERIFHELSRLICGDNAIEVLREYRDVITVILPELAPCIGFAQHSPYHIYDVYEHTIRSVAAITPDPLLRFTMLLHDAGKPATFTQDPDGTGHFRGHGDVSLTLAQQAMQRLKVSRHFFDRVSVLIRYHDLRLEPTEPCLKRWLNRLGEETLRQLLAVQAADCAAQSPDLIGRLDMLVRQEQILDNVLKQQSCFSLRDLAVNGCDLMALGIPAGTMVGEWLNRLLDTVIDGACPNDKETLLALALSWYKAEAHS